MKKQSVFSGNPGKVGEFSKIGCRVSTQQRGAFRSECIFVCYVFKEYRETLAVLIDRLRHDENNHN